MRKFVPIIFTLFFLFFYCQKTQAKTVYYNQDESTGELYMNGYPDNVDYWTEDRVSGLKIPGTTEPLLFEALGYFSTTTTDQYVSQISLWMSGSKTEGQFVAFYSCDHDIPNYSDPTDATTLNNSPQKVSFNFPIYNNCNLKNNPLTNFGVYFNGPDGLRYPEGVYFLASNQNPVPYVGIYFWDHDHGSFLDDYDIKTEIATKDATEFKTPVLFIPGVLGTNLNEGDERLWLNFAKSLTDHGDEFMDDLLFNENFSSGHNIVTSDIVRNPSNLFNYSQGLINMLSIRGYEENANLFTFPYDWRYGVTATNADSKTNVDLLAEKIQEILQKTGSDKIDIIAHSTGGLLLKKYVSLHPDDHHINKAIMVGVPNLGAPKALKVLSLGDNFDIPFLDHMEMKKLAKNFPVVYDLAPSQNYYDLAGNYFYSFKNSEGNKPSFWVRLDHEEAEQFLINVGLGNEQGFNLANNLHSQDFDDLDLGKFGINVYNITGCKKATLSKMEFMFYGGGVYDLVPFANISGDGTVPLISSQSILTQGSKQFYVIDAEHAKMPSADGIRQLITNIVTGSDLPVGKKIINQYQLNENPGQCELKAHWWQIFSPISITITDQEGNQAGPSDDGSILNNIPGLSYELYGEKKFIFLPTDSGQTYSVAIKGTGTGTFILKTSDVNANQVSKAAVFINIPVTPELTGSVKFNPDSISLLLNNTPGGTSEEIFPTVFLTEKESQDIIPPETRVLINNSVPEQTNYSKPVTLSLEANDTAENSSGVFGTYYNLDNTGWFDFSSTTSLAADESGGHTLKFYSVDRAGNKEQEREIDFNISVPASAAVNGFPAQFLPKSSTGFSTDTGTTLLPVQPKPEVLSASVHGTGALIIFPGDPTVYLVSGVIKHPFYSARQFLALGYNFLNVSQAFSGDNSLMLGMPVGE